MLIPEFNKDRCHLIALSEEDAAFILSAIGNYDGIGPPRSDIRKKMLAILSAEQAKAVKDIWCSRTTGRTA